MELRNFVGLYFKVVRHVRVGFLARVVSPPALARSDVDSKFSYKFLGYMKFSFEVNDWSLEWTVVFM